MSIMDSVEMKQTEMLVTVQGSVLTWECLFIWCRSRSNPPPKTRVPRSKLQGGTPADDDSLSCVAADPLR